MAISKDRRTANVYISRELHDNISRVATLDRRSFSAMSEHLLGLGMAAYLAQDKDEDKPMTREQVNKVVENLSKIPPIAKGKLNAVGFQHKDGAETIGKIETEVMPIPPSQFPRAQDQEEAGEELA